MKRVLSLMLIASGAMLGAAAAPSLAADATARPKVDLAKGEQLFNDGDPSRNVISCASCHGPGGNSPGAANPKLAGQHPEYLYKQLANFKVKEGAKKPERVNAVMNAIAAGLTDEEMRNISAYLGAQALKPAVAKNKDTVELGQRIYRAGIPSKGVPACASCHSPNGSGIPSQYPRVAGQFAEYTESQLVAFRSGARANSLPMTQVAEKMSDAEIKAVSDYIAGLR
ncbi:c-type cytochrome [Pigmentiphaga sp.]|mgnify:CR=1 FL=1|jgi:Cytochrome c553|uniref:c-type cytochrome n=1 Tax=Pigmentiphaga sp. TaxID=1977564 RepID=UPI0025E43A50|nr:c-type cytochrome [Pigmentiphaga sp.]MBX6318142.1 cytochrome c4 [Pigmentiphaga sp.]